MDRRIVHTDDTCSGTPRIDGTRLTCANVVLLLGENGMPIARFLQTYPHLDSSDVETCLRYCSQQQCIADQVANFCQGCSLDLRVSESPDDPHAAENAADIAAANTNEDYSVDVWKIASERIEREDD